MSKIHRGNVAKLISAYMNENLQDKLHIIIPHKSTDDQADKVMKTVDFIIDEIVKAQNEIGNIVPKIKLDS